MSYRFNLLFFAIVLAAQLLLPLTSAQAVVRISNMNDFNFGTWSGSGDLSISDSICIYDSAGGTYRVRATTNRGAFRVQNLAGNILNFTTQWQGSSGVLTTLAYNTLTTFSAPHTTSSTCLGGTNATFRITFTAANMQVAPVGNYTATISVLLAP